MEDCLFCKIVAGEIPSRRLYEDDRAIGFLDVSPFHRGHSLVVPRRHLADGTTDPAVWGEVGPALVAVAGLLKDKLGATGINLLANAGADAGQSVFHFHVHVVPRYADNPGMAGLTKRAPGADDDLDGLLAQLLG